MWRRSCTYIHEGWPSHVIFLVVRDRYQLARICMVSPSNNIRCGFCHNYFNGSEILLDTTCYGNKMHMICYYEKARACPYCGEAFYTTTCYLCKMDVWEMHTTPQKKSRTPWSAALLMSISFACGSCTTIIVLVGPLWEVMELQSHKKKWKNMLSISFKTVNVIFLGPQDLQEGF